MIINTKILEDIDFNSYKIVVTQFVCETIEEFEQAKKIAQNFDRVEFVNKRGVYKGKEYCGCVVIFQDN